MELIGVGSTLKKLIVTIRTRERTPEAIERYINYRTA